MKTFKNWIVSEGKLFIWQDTGTQFKDIGNNKSYFNGKNGEQFTIQIEGGGVPTVIVYNKNGQQVGSVPFTPNGEGFKGPKGTYSTSYVKVKNEYQSQGIARAMYDYFTRKIGPIYRSDYQEPEGRVFWNKNKSPMGNLPEKEQISRALVPKTVQVSTPLAPEQPEKDLHQTFEDFTVIALKDKTLWNKIKNHVYAINDILGEHG
jgi:hypothetical protein